MTILRMAWRYVWTRPLVSILTIVGVLLGSALICSVLLLRRETEQTLVKESTVYDLVVGAKGSPLQLVLSSIYHLDIPTGNIAYDHYETLKGDSRVRTAIPLGLGDNYRGFRIVGTSRAYFDAALCTLDHGGLFTNDFEAVLGHQVAQQTGLRIGDTFVGTHGLVALTGSEEHEAFPYTVVGILEAGGTSSDRAIFTTLGSVWKVHDKEEEFHANLFGGKDETLRPPEREVTAVLVQLKAVGMRLWMAQEINDGTQAMAAVPVNEMLRLYHQILTPMQRALLGVAALVVVVSSLSIVATLYQAAERRRRDMAILRMLGAHPREIFLLVFLEAVFLIGLGILGGWLIGHGGVAVAEGTLREMTGLSINAWTFGSDERVALLCVGVAGLLTAAVSAALAYRRMPVHDLAQT